MSRRFLFILLLYLGLHTPAVGAAAQRGELPWAPDARCRLNPAHPNGLHPDALSALQSLALAHRITQGMNTASEAGNVHQADVTVDGKPYTGAVDISVRCLTEAQIRTLLGRLAHLGFAAWRRQPGQDSWTGPPHIHAVWAGCRLKPVLRQQVESWLSGGNGLFTRDQAYRFWQPTAEMKDKVRALYRTSN
jgi:hypothetical protein